MNPTRSVARRLVVVLAALCAFASSAPAQDAPPAFRVRMHRNIPYVTGAGADAKKHRLDVYEPVGAPLVPKDPRGPEGKGAPVLMTVHGGAWQHGSKLYDLLLAHTFAECGIVTVAIDYRLSPEIRHPAHIRDVARAFDWVKRNVAKYGGDPDRVFIAGHSAGGHLVALLATNDKYLAEVGRTSEEIAGVIPISGLFRVGATSFVFKNTFDPTREQLEEASPEFHVDDKQPPFLIIYAEHDLPLLDIQAIGMTRALEAHKSPVRLLRAADRNHVSIVLMIGTKDDPVTDAMLDFIRGRAVDEKR